MSSTFLLLRYLAFALFISFSAVICSVAALNLGSLAPNTPRLPEVDTYLIFLGAFGLLIVFPVIFVELIRKNAFITRVVVEITWIALLWIMHLSGAAAITAVSPQTLCSPIAGGHPPVDCSSTKVLLAFTWLCTITLLSYLLALLSCAVYHHQEDSRVWSSGVRDYRWFKHRQSLQSPPAGEATFSYGKLVDPKTTYGPPPAIYAEQMGLARSYSIEPLKIETTIERPVPPVPAASSGSRLISKDSVTRRVAPPVLPPPSNSLSLYPQHLQATVGDLPALPARVNERTPPPAGVWPRSNPQEPLRRKQLPAAGSIPTASSVFPPLILASPEPEMGEREGQVTMGSNASRSKPSGPRTPSSHRPRPPPLDLSRLSFHNGPQR